MKRARRRTEVEEHGAHVRVLFSQADEQSNRPSLTAFALDLTADQAKHQVIVAVLPRRESLRETLGELSRRIAEHPPGEHSASLQDTDIFRVPNVAFHLNHEFTELQGLNKTIKNPGDFYGQYIRAAFQSIRFRLDKSGVVVVSETYMYPGAMPRHFVFDRPFLIVMKRRVEDEPYFVAWIDNAEFLEINQQSGPAENAEEPNNI